MGFIWPHTICQAGEREAVAGMRPVAIPHWIMAFAWVLLLRTLLGEERAWPRRYRSRRIGKSFVAWVSSTSAGLLCPSRAARWLAVVRYIAPARWGWAVRNFSVRACSVSEAIIR